MRIKYLCFSERKTTGGGEMKEIPVGESFEKEGRVTEDLATFHFSGGEVGVLSTPKLIDFIEFTCIDFLEKFCDEGENSVGTRVDVRHLAPTPIGMSFRVKVTTKEVEGRRVLFQVEGYDEKDKIVEGVHERFVIRVDKFIETIKKKGE
ncbi:MAG: hypothetical protein D6713_10665 [Deltaproteobacteria bacterium]|nr:MAG: hypothetical protein D6713_10665 [Deltaproteobacteria bacterium]